MSSTTVHSRPEPTPERRLLRHRAADRVAARLHLALSEGWSRRVIAQYLGYRWTRFNEYPYLARVLAQASAIAEGGDPGQVRVSRTPRGNLQVIRLHGPDWSVILTPGRPFPGILLTVEDYGHLCAGQPLVWRVDTYRFEKRVIAMNLAILAALDTGAPSTSPNTLTGSHHDRTS